MLTRFIRTTLASLCLLAPLGAQTVFRLGEPLALTATGQGWSVATNHGALQFAFPVLAVSGDMPVPVVFRMNGSHTAATRMVTRWNEELHQYVEEPGTIDRPVYGTAHFGYIGGGGNFDGFIEQAHTVLENGQRIGEDEWGSASAIMSSFTLPSRFGFTNITDLTSRPVPISPLGSIARYDAALSDFGSHGTSVQAALPTGFSAANDFTAFRVVMDKDKARVFVRLVEFNAWVPLLWVDRGGREVSFKWAYQNGATLPVSCTVLVNGGQRGVKVAWTDAPSSDVEQLLLETSFVGSQTLDLPSLRVYGYPGAAADRPVGFTQQATAFNPVVPDIPGLRGRPSRVEMTADNQTRTWSFGYDANKAEVATLTDAAGVVTTFTTQSYAVYQTATDPDPLWLRGVSATSSVAPNSGGTISRTWSRSLPQSNGAMWTSLTWTTTYSENQSTTESGGGRHMRYTFAAANSPHYGNSPLLLEETLNAGGTRVAQTVYDLALVGLDQSSSLSTSVGSQQERDGEPNRVVTTTTTPDGLFTETESLSVGGVLVKSLLNESAGDASQLEPYRPTQSSQTLRSQGVVLGSLVTAMEYRTDGLPLKSYEIAGANLRAGQSYTWAGGRLESATTFADGITAGATTQTLGYNSQGAVSSVTTSGGGLSLATTAGYSLEGFPSSQTDVAGNTTTMTYDGWGRPITVSKPGEPTITITYSGLFNRTLTQSGQSRGESYDAFGRLKSVSLPGGRSQTFTYDHSGRQVSTKAISAGGVAKTSTTHYDDLDRVVSSVSSTGVDTVNQYDANGETSHIASTTRGSVVTHTYLDGLGRVIRQIAPDGVVTESTYNARGQVLQVKITAGQVQTRSFEYDDFGRLTKRTEPETGVTQFSNHTVTGAPRTILEDGGRTRTLIYDGLGRLTSSTGNIAGSSTNTTYHYAGALMDWAQSGDYTTFYTYGGPGHRISQERQQKGGADLFTIQYGYDANARLGTLTYPSGRVVSYAYDGQGRVSGLQQKAPGAGAFTSVVNAVNYDDWGALSKITFASLAQSEWKSDALGNHLDKWTVGYTGGTPEQRKYLYDSLDNLLKAGDWDVTHDSMGRLQTANHAGLGIQTTHGHDGFGNNITHGVTPGTQTPQPLNAFSFTALPNNRIPGFTTTGGATGWSMNARGEATAIGTWMSSPSTINLTWDALGRLASASAPNAAQTYAYGPHGLRVEVADSLQPLNNRRYAYASGGILLGEYVPAPNPARTGHKAARVYHKNGTHSALSRGLGAFAAGDTVTVSVWFKAAAGLSGQVFLDDRRAYGANEAKVSASAPGDGTWKRLTFTKTLAQADNLWIHLYGDMYTPTSGNATDASSVLYDDLQVSSTDLGVVLGDGFENGLTVGVDPDSTSAWTTSGETADVVVPVFDPTAWNRDVLYLGGQAVAEVDAAGVHELHADHLGSPLIITAGPGAQAGTIEGRQVFGPYGELIQANGYKPITGYTGHVSMDPTGLIYMRGRFYSPAWHRFLNSDQGVDTNSWNQFAYVGGSPFQSVDPSGMCLDLYWVKMEYDKKTGEWKEISREWVTSIGCDDWGKGGGSRNGSGDGGGGQDPFRTFNDLRFKLSSYKDCVEANRYKYDAEIKMAFAGIRILANQAASKANDDFDKNQHDAILSTAGWKTSDTASVLWPFMNKSNNVTVGATGVSLAQGFLAKKALTLGLSTVLNFGHLASQMSNVIRYDDQAREAIENYYANKISEECAQTAMK